MKVFGLIGKTLGHSFSPAFFEEKFLRENIPDCRYKLFPLDEISSISDIANNNPEVKGFNVTIPYKRDVIPFLGDISPDAKKLGAVNTIKIIRTQNHLKLIGFNTDTYGFQHACTALRLRYPALVLGTGGSAQAIKFVLDNFQIPCLAVSRKPSYPGEIGYGDMDKKMLEKYRLIINTTPLGMFPDIESCPDFPYELLNQNHFLYDLIYNPTETAFLKHGRLAGCHTENGRLMLELQAERSWEIWNAD